MHPIRRQLSLLLVGSVVALCSCRLMPQREDASVATATTNKSTVSEIHAAEAPHPSPVRRVAYSPPALPPGAYTGEPSYAPHYAGGHAPRHCEHCQGEPGVFHFSSHAEALQWAPDGLALPWPQDEYLSDGGDRNADVHVKQNFDVVGLDQEDTVAHYDTLDGRTEISVANKVCIYAPRFAAVRKVTNPVITEVHERMAGVEKSDKLNLHEKTFIPTTNVQPEGLRGQQAIDLANVFRERRAGIELDHAAVPYLAQAEFLPFEDFDIIRRGVYEQSDKPRLAASARAAEVWLDRKAVQVVIDGKMAVEASGLFASQETRMYELEGKPRLRICKVASRSDAQVGETVDFTLRFDNVGEQTIGNVTILDSLTTRLEYVDGSQTSTRKADFKTQENEGESLVLRWELIEPLKVNEGGIIRFKCKVR